jgi:hypothetical protein
MVVRMNLCPSIGSISCQVVNISRPVLGLFLDNNKRRVKTVDLKSFAFCYTTSCGKLQYQEYSLKLRQSALLGHIRNLGYNLGCRGCSNMGKF